MPDGPSRYAYVANSPLMYIDPTGESLRLPTWFWPGKPQPLSPGYCEAPGGFGGFNGPLFNEKSGYGTPDRNPDGWEKISATKPQAFVPKGRKEPVLQGDRAGGRARGGGKQYKKWNKRRDFDAGKPRDETVNEKG